MRGPFLRSPILNYNNMTLKQIHEKFKSKIMYRVPQMSQTTLEVNQEYEGESIEEKINRIVNNNEPISDGAPIIYTDRKDGVGPEYNIRSDRFEIAIDAMSKVAKSHIAKRAEMHAVKDDEISKNESKNETGGQSIEGTSNE